MCHRLRGMWKKELYSSKFTFALLINAIHEESSLGFHTASNKRKTIKLIPQRSFPHLTSDILEANWLNDQKQYFVASDGSTSIIQVPLYASRTERRRRRRSGTLGDQPGPVFDLGRFDFRAWRRKKKQISRDVFRLSKPHGFVNIPSSKSFSLFPLSARSTCPDVRRTEGPSRP